ncbi:MAG TPA: sigma-70 family RNA polymerase sigma factor [Bryobacteraceae bacterium]|nr:sigma-70 family RNA polymerase sigma factor [Bryobacteraceae bacterium]
MAARRPAETAVRNSAEERLLVEAVQKDPAKFGDLYEAYFELIYGFIARRVSDRATAEDLTSDVFHKALANLRSYEWRGVPFAAWLIRIAANAVVDQSKRAAREVPARDDLPEPSAQPNMEGLEDRALLFRLVNQLPDDQRRVIQERFVDEMSIREIAGRLGRSEGAVKQLQLRALEKLRKQLGGAHA